VAEETTAFANAMVFDGSSAELREGCVRVAAGTIAEVGGGRRRATGSLTAVAVRSCLA
jgi:hypothetical protein